VTLHGPHGVALQEVHAVCEPVNTLSVNASQVNIAGSSAEITVGEQAIPPPVPADAPDPAEPLTPPMASAPVPPPPCAEPDPAARPAPPVASEPPLVPALPPTSKGPRVTKRLR
jgi:hypothetical protein